jgi:hypothetical protein
VPEVPYGAMVTAGPPTWDRSIVSQLLERRTKRRENGRDD